MIKLCKKLFKFCYSFPVISGEGSYLYKKFIKKINFEGNYEKNHFYSLLIIAIWSWS